MRRMCNRRSTAEMNWGNERRFQRGSLSSPCISSSEKASPPRSFGRLFDFRHSLEQDEGLFAKDAARGTAKLAGAWSK